MMIYNFKDMSDIQDEPILTGMYVKFREVIDPGDESVRMLVIDDYGEDSDRCLVKDLNWRWALGSTRVVLKGDLIAI